jgi:glycosyltransferase involved in cell wall biosynthesis
VIAPTQPGHQGSPNRPEQPIHADREMNAGAATIKSVEVASVGPQPAAGPRHRLRLAVFTDHLFWREGERVYSDRVFPTFVAAMAPLFERLVLIARVHPEAGRSHYEIPAQVEIAPLPWVDNLSRPGKVVSMTLRSIRRYWRMLDDVDVIWLVGSYATSLPFALIAALRGKKVAFGIRQDLPSYARGRHPDRRSVHVAADLLEGVYRALARFFPFAVVGPDLADRFKHAPRLLDVSVSLISEHDVLPVEQAVSRPYDGELVILNVGRVEMEKNPLLLADVLAGLRARDPRWRLVVCGDGPMLPDLAARLAELGVAEHADLRGYVTMDDGLLEAYRSSHAFLHVSWTEGLPQIMFEAFAAGLPVAATAVGGVAAGVGDAALLMPPGEAGAAVAALEQIATDAETRERLIRRGIERAHLHTTESECRRLADFLAGTNSS